MKTRAKGAARFRVKPVPFVGGYAVAVMCRDEQHQRQVFEALQQMGYELKVLTL